MPDEGIRINKYIADSGLCSRREADGLIARGKVFISGTKARPGDKVLPGDTVVCEGKQVEGRSTKHVYIALNKPEGIICTTDPEEPDNVVDFVGYPERIFPIGRLDRDSRGLLLLTTDGDIVNRILRAEGRHEKEYIVDVDRPVTPEFLRGMARGVPILDTVTLPCTITRTGLTQFDIVLTQGLNRQIRRMCEYFGYRVTALERVRIMNIRLGHLHPGDWRHLTPAELTTLRSILDKGPGRQQRRVSKADPGRYGKTGHPAKGGTTKRTKG